MLWAIRVRTTLSTALLSGSLARMLIHEPNRTTLSTAPGNATPGSGGVVTLALTDDAIHDLDRAAATRLGVEVEGNELRFDGRFTDGQARFIARRLSGRTTHLATFQGVGEASEVTDEDLDVINGRIGTTLKAEEVRVFERLVINDKPVRRGLYFTTSALEKFAEDYSQGRSVMLYHNRERPIGGTISARVIEETVRGVEANWVQLRTYVPIHDETDWPIRQLETGVLSYDSIGFIGGDYEMEEVGSGRNARYIMRIDYDNDDFPPLEAVELSHVYHGEAYGAGSNIFS